MQSKSQDEQFRAYYRTLRSIWGGPHWWPARTRFEVIIGAYLTQNTAWTNVEHALRGMRAAGLLSIAGVRRARLHELEAAVRPSGYFRQKARRLKLFVAFLDEHYGGSLDRMFRQPTDELRAQLLALDGVGPETADSILLYAGQRPVFVVDAYTRRILERHHTIPGDAPYEEIRHFCEEALKNVNDDTTFRPTLGFIGGAATHPPSRMSLAKRSPTAQVYNDMHGLIVGVGKSYCLKSRPRCDECPLRSFLPE